MAKGDGDNGACFLFLANDFYAADERKREREKSERWEDGHIVVVRRRKTERKKEINKEKKNQTKQNMKNKKEKQSVTDRLVYVVYVVLYVYIRYYIYSS